MNFSEAVRNAHPGDLIVGNQRRMFKIDDDDTLRAANADEYKMNGTVPSKFELAAPDLYEIVDLSWKVIPKETDKIDLWSKFKGSYNEIQAMFGYINALLSPLNDIKSVERAYTLSKALKDAQVMVENLKAIAIDLYKYEASNGK